jgi:hypothetical protein
VALSAQGPSADPRNPDDIKFANILQDAIKVEQPSVGKFEVPNWDPVSQKKIRGALRRRETHCQKQGPGLTGPYSG